MSGLLLGMVLSVIIIIIIIIVVENCCPLYSYSNSHRFCSVFVDSKLQNFLSARWYYAANAIRKDSSIFKGKFLTGLLP
jgi:hypothetical protein